MGFRLEPTECANHVLTGGPGCSAWGGGSRWGSTEGSARSHSPCPSPPRGSLPFLLKSMFTTLSGSNKPDSFSILPSFLKYSVVANL